MKKTTVKTEGKLSTSQVDTLADDLVSLVNSNFKDSLDKTAYILSDPDVASDVTEWISTGLDVLDLAISNRPGGGYPVGRITEITGLEATGKSLLAAYALKSTQQRGGLGVYIDTEAAVSREYLEAIGVDTSKLLYIPMEALEDVFETIELIVAKARKSSRDRIVTIVVDSIMGASTKLEIESDYDKDGWNTSKAIILSKAMRKMTNMIARQKICLIFTNQLRARLGVSFGDPYCVDPLSTLVTIKLAQAPDREAITKSLANIGKMFLELKDEDLSVPGIYDLSHRKLVVKTQGTDGFESWTPLLNYVVKDPIDHHYTDGKIKVSGNHKFVEHYLVSGNTVQSVEILACDHPEFKRVEKPINIVDIEVGGDHTYLANGRLNHNTTSGGKAIPYHSSVRLRLTSLGKIKTKDAVFGIQTKCIIQKNRLGPPLKEVSFDIYFDSGIDNYGSWLNTLNKYNLLEKGGSYYTLKFDEPLDIVNPNNGEVSKVDQIKFMSKQFAGYVEANPVVKEMIYKLICSKLVVPYKVNQDFGIDDIEIDANLPDEEA